MCFKCQVAYPLTINDKSCTYDSSVVTNSLSANILFFKISSIEIAASFAQFCKYLKAISIKRDTHVI